MRKIFFTCVLFLIAFAGLGQFSAIRVEKFGDQGEPVLYLPGFATPGSVWRETIQHLAVPHQNYIVSYAGFNGIPAIKMPWYQAIRNELITLIRNEDLRNVAIIGHSMGGNLAVDLAAALPGRVSKIVIVDAIPCMRELMMPGVSANQLQYNSPYNQQMLSMTEAAIRTNAKMMAESMTFNKNMADTLMQWMLEADRETFVYGYTDLLKLDLRDVLGNITAKTLILGASFPDKEIVTRNFEKQYEKLANKTLEIAADSKHFIMFDQPVWLYEKINSFLSK